jgi:hypothetical protein
VTVPELPVKFTDPLYVAVTMSEPLGTAEVVNDATPPLNVPDPSVLVPILNVTPPVGVPSYCGVTIAVNVTACPRLDGFGDELSAVIVAALLTISLSAGDVLPA